VLRPTPSDPWQVALVEFGHGLRGLRDDANLTQKVLAQRIGNSDSTLSDLERGIGTRVPSEDLVVAYVDHCLAHWKVDDARKAERRIDLVRRHRLLGELREHLQRNVSGGHTLAEMPAPVSTMSLGSLPVANELAESLLVFINSVGGKSSSQVLSMSWNIEEIAWKAAAKARLDYLGPRIEVVHDGIVVIFSGKVDDSYVVSSFVGAVDEIICEYEGKRNYFHPRLQARVIVDRGPVRATDTGLIGTGFEDLSVMTQLLGVRDALAADEGVNLVLIIADPVFSRLQKGWPAGFDRSEFIPTMHFQEGLSGPKGLWIRVPGYKGPPAQNANSS
jgi:DNA-binding XRE family transcriptional regulator